MKSDKKNKRYEKPEVKRIDLAMEETLSAGCKVWDVDCGDSFAPLADNGS